MRIQMLRAVAVTLTLAACGGNERATAGAPGDSAASAAPAPGRPAPGAAPPAEAPASPPAGAAGRPGRQPFEGTLGPTGRRPDGGITTQVAVRAARQHGFDRTVFEFSGERVPGYRIEYVDRPVRQCASGEVVPVAGDAWLRVSMSPARAHDDAGNATVAPRSLAPRLPALKQLTLTCDFEARLEWVLGLVAPNRYRVLELAQPPRLVVDVLH